MAGGNRGMGKLKLNLKMGGALDNIKHKIVVMSGKGGVGKSTVAANLALALSMNGVSVGLLDCDIHGPSIPKMLGIEGEVPTATDSGINPVTLSTGLKLMSMGFFLSDKDTPVVWRGPLKMRAIRQFLEDVEWGELDYLVIDLPPGTGDEPLSVAQLIPKVDGAVIVTTPQDVALLSVRKSINFARHLNMPIIGLIENMSGFVCPHCGNRVDIFGSGGGLKASQDMGIPFLGRIPIDPVITSKGDEGKSFIMEQRDSDSTRAFEDIVKNIKEFINKNPTDNP